MAEWFHRTVGVPYYCVVGSPVAHSKSPLIHAAFAAQCGIDLVYEKVEVAPGCLSAALAEFRAVGGRGLNVTVPLKEEAWALADVRMPRAARAGAANTLWFEDEKLIADNTDGLGLVRDLEINHGAPLAGKRIALLGAGGASMGVLPALLDAQPSRVLITNRTLARAERLAASHADSGRVEVLPWGAAATEACDIVINGTSLSLQGQTPNLHSSLLDGRTLCYDMMYGAQPTHFMEWAAERGAARVLDGLGMLVEQAAAAFSIWNGQQPHTAPVITMVRERIAAGT
ncbi:MAG: shikimate dehydrogenase [Gammaproteobacteria bacterium]|nr:shikimate dehydrogenase [Gammaproteobacteria bacterium]